MRMSCNGCRALRKGCSENCSIRPCLQWIPTAQSQASATLFLVKFYGRTCLINLINAGTQNLRPGIFKSLLYEACGRIVNPVHCSAGLILSGDWHLCEAAVEAVLSGEPIGQVSYDCKALGLSFKSSYDIRHVTKLENNSNKVGRIKAGGVFKRSKKEKTKADEEEENCYGGDGDAVSVETVEDSSVKTGELELELSLGVGTRPRKRRNNINGCDDAMCKPAQG